MKITKIEFIDGIYHVTQKPDLIECLFGKKEVVERYKRTGDVYAYFPHVEIFRKSTGEVPQATDKVTKALNNFVNSF